MGGKGGFFQYVLKQRNLRAYLATTEEEQDPSGEGCIMTSSSALFSPPSSASILFRKESSDGICHSTINTFRFVEQCGRKHEHLWFFMVFPRGSKNIIKKTGGIIQAKKKKKKAWMRAFLNRREGATEPLVMAVV